MKEILIVILSAVVGYVVLSAFSTTDSPKEAIRRIIKQPQIIVSRERGRLGGYPDLAPGIGEQKLGRRFPKFGKI